MIDMSSLAQCIDPLAPLFWDQFWRVRSAFLVPGVEARDIAEKCGSIRPGNAFLEIGVGDGRNLLVVCQAGLRVHGIDFSSVAIARAKARLQKEGFSVDLELGSAGNLPYPDEHFAFITAIDVLNHLPEPEVCMAEVHRVLAPEGRVYANALSVRDPNRAMVASLGREVAHNLYQLPSPEYESGQEVSCIMRYYEIEDVKRIIGGFGCETPLQEYVRIDGGDLPPFSSVTHEHVFWRLDLRKVAIQ